VSWTPWPDEKVEQLKAAFNEGLTFAQIGERIGMGRAACIGKAHRLGLERDEDQHPRKPRGPYKRKELEPPVPVTVNVPNRASLGTSGPLHRPVSVAKIQCDEPTMPVGRHKHIPSAMLPPRVPQPAPFGPRPIEQLEPQHCRFPLGGLMDAPPFTFCGEAALGAGPYCRDHAARAYQPRGGRTA
jgi:hypothetical protein